MDLSKIPGKQGDAPAAPETPAKPAIPMATPIAAPVTSTEPSPRPVPAVDTRYRGEDVWYSGPEVMFALGVGVILCYLGQNALKLVFSAVGMASPPPGATDLATGTQLTYVQSWFFVGDLPLALLGVAMILEGVAMGVIKKPAAGFAAAGALLLAGVVAVGAQLYLMPKVGLQLMLLLATLMGFYLGWSAILRLRGTPR